LTLEAESSLSPELLLQVVKLFLKCPADNGIQVHKASFTEQATEDIPQPSEHCCSTAEAKEQNC
jgi:hypothetical protein